MEKPKAMALIVGPDASPLLTRTVRIETHTDEARRWVQSCAKEFGELCRDPFGDDKRWSLYLYCAYDRAEVIEYLLYKWDWERWPEDVGVDIVAESESK